MSDIPNPEIPKDNKEEALDSFLKGLRVSFNYISLYSKNHKSFLSSIEDLKNKTDYLFNYLNPIKIGFTADALYIDSAEYGKVNLHKELAKIFHLRKIKSLEIYQGVTNKDLAFLLDKISLPPREILKMGGWSHILDSSTSFNFKIEELDYSSLLKDEGEEGRDVWAYLLKDAVSKGNTKQIDELAFNFEKYLHRFKISNVIADQHVETSIAEFLEYLKKTDKVKFTQCTKGLLKLMLRDKDLNTTKEEQFNKLQSLLNGLTEEDFADVLWEQVSKDQEFDAYSFDLFSKLLGEDKHKRIADNLTEKAAAEGFNPKTAKKIKELFSLKDGNLISQVYREALSSIGDSFASQGQFSFDKEHLQKNYFNILLTDFDFEDSLKRLDSVIQKILVDWDKIANKDNLEYLKFISGVLKKKKQKFVSLKILEDLASSFYLMIENMIWQEQLPDGFEDILGEIDQSLLGFEAYEQRIFEEDKLNPCALKLFFKFFPDKADNFYQNMQRRKLDFEFSSNVINMLKFNKDNQTLDVLRKLYPFSHEIIKIEIIKAMSEFPLIDRSFLMPLLASENLNLKKEAFKVLINDDNSRLEAVRLLLDIKDPWGFKNDLILENIEIVDEAKIIDAWDYLKILSKKPFFWNQKVRQRAKMALERFSNG